MVFNSKEMVFSYSEVLLIIEEDPLKKSEDLNDLLVAHVINIGKLCDTYKKDDMVLVRRDIARELKTPFAKNERLVKNEKDILCKYPK